MYSPRLSHWHRLAVEAATKALLDAGINYDEVEQAFAGYVYGVSSNLFDLCSGSEWQFGLCVLMSRLRSGTGLHLRTTCVVRSRLDLNPDHQRQQQVRATVRNCELSTPVLTVLHSCSTGSSALWLARQAVEYGISDCVMALGFEKVSGWLPSTFNDARSRRS